MPSRYRSGGLGKANLFDTNVKATQIDEDIFTDKEVLSSIADDDLVLLLDVSEDPDEIKYMTKSNFVSGLTVLTGSTDNTLVSVTGANAISGEANLLFDGTILTNDGGEIDIDISSGDPHLSFQIGGTDEFTIGVDDSDSDIFKIDTGGTVGGATKLSIDSSGNVIIAGGLTTGSTSFVNSSGVIQVASQTNITGLGTISTGTWQGTAIASAYLDSDTAHLTGTQTFSGVKTFSSGFARGSDAEGDILYSNGSAYVRLARGSDDQVLTLASGVPSWATPTVGDITGVTAGVGLSGGGTTGGVTLTLDLSELSDVTPANGDKLSTLDSDGSTEQLTTVASLATLFAGTGLTASSSVIGVDASQAITALTGGDLTIYEDANNADVSLKMGTSATESLSIEVLNGGANKTAEEIRITTATASGTANHGKIAIYIDGAEILDIDDGGIDMASGMTVALNGTDIESASGANTALTSIYNTSLKMGRDSENLIDFATTDNKIILRVNNVDEVELVENALSPVTSDGVALGTGSLMWSDLFVASGAVVNFNNGDVLLTHASNTLTLTGGDFVIGVDDTGHDVKFFGASAGAYMLYDQSEDQLVVMGASADATTSTGKLLLATSLTDINANDVIGKIDFQAPHEGGGTDAITVAASIQAIAQGTFSSSVNATDLVFYTGHSEAATEKFRFTSQGEIGIGGANYGTDGQVLTSGGAGAAPAWEDAGGGGGTTTLVADGAIAAGAPVYVHTDGKAKQATSGIGMPQVMDSENAQGIASNGGYVIDLNISGSGNSRVFAYWKQSSNGYMWGCVGTVQSNNSVTWGTPAAIKEAAGDLGPVCQASDDFTKVFCGYTISSVPKGVIVTVDNSDNTFSVGTERTTGDTGENNYNGYSACWDDNRNKVFVAYNDVNLGGAGNTSYRRMKVRSFDPDNGFTGTVLFMQNSNTGGSSTGVKDDSNAYYIVAAYNPSSQQNVVTWRQQKDGGSVETAWGATFAMPSGTGACTTGGAVEIKASINGIMDLEYDPDTSGNYMVVAYNVGNEIFLNTLDHAASGNTLDLGTERDTNLAYNYASLAYDTEENKMMCIAYKPDSGGIFTFTIPSGNPSAAGTVATWTQTDPYPEQYGQLAACWSEEHNKIIFVYRDGENSNRFTTIVFTEPYTAGDLDDSSNGFIGYNTSAVSDGATATITVAGGVNENQTGLTVGTRYYADGGGNLHTTNSGIARPIYAGVATAATKLLVNGAYISTDVSS